MRTQPRVRGPLLASFLLLAPACKRDAPNGPPPVAERARMQVDATSAESLYLAGQQEFVAGEFDRAADYLRRSLRLAPSARAWQGLGDVLMSQARFAEAADAFREAVKLEPGKWLSWTRLGRCLLNSGRAAEAAEAYRTARGLRPGDARPMREEAEALVAAHREDEAVELLERAGELDPSGRLADLRLIGQIRQVQQRHADAANAFRRATEVKPEAATFNDLATSLVHAGDLPGAGAAFAKAAELDPKDPSAWEMVAEIRLRLGDAKAAREAFQASLEVKERTAPHLALARLARSEGALPAARAELDRALQAATGEEATEAREIAALAAELGEWAMAEQLLAMLSSEEEAGRDATLWVELARARQALGKRKEAGEACARANSLGNGGPCPPATASAQR